MGKALVDEGQFGHAAAFSKKHSDQRFAPVCGFGNPRVHEFFGLTDLDILPTNRAQLAIWVMNIELVASARSKIEAYHRDRQPKWFEPSCQCFRLCPSAENAFPWSVEQPLEAQRYLRIRRWCHHHSSSHQQFLAGNRPVNRNFHSKNGGNVQ